MGHISCNSLTEPWEANVLQSPEMNLTTDTIMTFKLNKYRRGRLDIYATSDNGHVAYRFATFSPTISVIFAYNESESGYTMSYDGSNEPDQDTPSTISELFNTKTVCVPSSSYTAAFIASSILPEDFYSAPMAVTIADVLLTGTPCTAQSAPGKFVKEYPTS